MWSQDHGGYYSEVANSLVETTDGGYAIAGRTGDVNNNEYTNFWLVKTDEWGNIPEFPLLTLIVTGFSIFFMIR